jgi:hypothetical protein
MDLYHLRQGLHVIASSWDYHEGAESRISIRGNLVRFTHGLTLKLLRQALDRIILNDLEESGV